ncbi:TetR/AcrR family transcriptional regulator [Treponema sp. OMZ 840]|uniref:TetR/AcrR family transcriptional regulator n=1 Tax=Treponema sp. OMZ 840 TaxID=244313 RepID=UPI003D8CC757
MIEKVLVAKDNLNTEAKILFAAKEEFLNKGFAGTSVRTIAEKAGLTTGALYNKFKDKDAIFAALIGNVFDEFLKILKESHDGSSEKGFYSIKTTDISLITELSRERFIRMVDFFYDNYDEMKLIICSSKGSSYEHVFNDAVEFLEAETIRWLKKDGISVSRRTKFFIHVTVSSHFENMKEIFYHNLKKNEALEYILDFNAYHCGGWKQYWMEQINGK